MTVVGCRLAPTKRRLISMGRRAGPRSRRARAQSLIRAVAPGWSHEPGMAGGLLKGRRRGDGIVEHEG